MSYAYEHEFVVIQRVYVRSNSKNPEPDKALLEQGVDRCTNSDKYEHVRSEVSFVRTKEINEPLKERDQK